MDWSFLKELQDYEDYLRGYIGKRRGRANKILPRLHVNTDRENEESSGFYRRQSYRGVQGYGRGSI